MNQTDIPRLLDASLKARKNNDKLWFLFTGDAGIGKSEIIQQWASSQGNDFQFIDIRLAYMEGPDMTGLTYIVNGTTYHAIPEFWPKEGRGIIVFEELNRGHPTTQNAVMQILTDLKVGKHKIPNDFIIAAVVNPENGYAVSEIDPALKNRFVEIPIQFSKKHFLDWATKNRWSDRLLAFLSAEWVFKPVHVIENDTYISPRSLEKLNVVDKLHQQNTIDDDVWNAVVLSVLGNSYGPAYIAFIKNDRPVLASDIIENEKAALKRLKTISDGIPYRGDLIAASVSSITSAFKTGELPLDLLIKLENVLNTSTFLSMAASLPEMGIPGLEEFVKANKKWLIEVQNRRKTMEGKK